MGLPVHGARLIVERLPPAGGSCRLRGKELAHVRARRLAPGDAVVLVDGSGREALGRLTRADRGGLGVSVETVRDGPQAPAYAIHLAVCAVRPERLAWIVEKSAELAVQRITLVTSQLTQRFRGRPELVARLERVVRAAAKQAEHARWPSIDGPVSFSQALRSETEANRILLDSRGERFPAALSGSTALLVGPEGGWTPEELEEAIESGWTVASLAAGKLRAETAAVAAVALARAAMERGE